MNQIFSKWRDMEGSVKGINPFDALYSLITAGLVEGLSAGINFFNKTGIHINKVWKKGEKLRILFLAYSGARNTGAEVRVGECIKQINKIIGEENCELNIMTLNRAETEEYYMGLKFNSIEMSSVFFADVFKAVLDNHVIALVEGSCWKENFATALLLYFLYGAGLSAKLDKPCFSYAVDAGKMNKLNNFLSWLLCRDMTRIIVRSEDSSHVLEKIGLRTNSIRVDTAWTMNARSSSWARKKLKESGWDGHKPLIGIAFQNYFWWPVIPNLTKFARHLITGDTKNQYKLVYFYDYSEDDEREFRTFTKNVAEAVDRIAEKYNAQPVIIGMEALDRQACIELKSQLKNNSILFLCNDHIGEEMAGVLRILSLLVTTRYHAMVLSMPGAVPFIGLSRDERIKGVMKEINLLKDYYIDFRESDLTGTLFSKMERIMGDRAEKKRVTDVIRDNLPYYFAQMAMIGLDIRNMIREKFPEFPLKEMDESDPMNLVPDIPEQFIEATREKFREISEK